MFLCRTRCERVRNKHIFRDGFPALWSVVRGNGAARLDTFHNSHRLWPARLWVASRARRFVNFFRLHRPVRFVSPLKNRAWV